MGVRGVSGRGHARHAWYDMAGLALSRRGCIITMADRYQDRPFPSADQARGESDPLAELARLIGQNDPSGAAARPAPRPLQSRANVRLPQYDAPEELPDAPPAPPAWMQRARHEPLLPAHRPACTAGEVRPCCRRPWRLYRRNTRNTMTSRSTSTGRWCIFCTRT